MKNATSTVRIICEIGIIAALGFVFDELQGILSKGIFVSGGSIGFAMVAVLVMAYRRGALPAILTGLVMGLLDIATSAFILHPAQLLLDYILPYALVGVVGLLRPLYIRVEQKSEKILWIIAAAVIGGLLKFSSHYLSGVIFWADQTNFAWGLENMNPYLYSLVYNIAYIGPSIVLSAVLMVSLYLTAPRILNDKPIINDVKTENLSVFSFIISSFLIAGGTTIFIIYLIKYIQSFSDYIEGAGYGYDFDPDSMIVFVLGLFTAVLGINALIASFLKKFSYVRTSSNLLALVTASFVYAIARLIRMYVKGKDPTLYWVWFWVGLITVLICGIFFVISLISHLKNKNNSEPIEQLENN